MLHLVEDEGISLVSIRVCQFHHDHKSTPTSSNPYLKLSIPQSAMDGLVQIRSLLGFDVAATIYSY
jgi:hypothetical protein